MFQDFDVTFGDEFELIKVWSGASDTGVVEVLFNFGKGIFRGEPN